MIISELIELLEHCQQHYGDIPVKMILTPSNISFDEVDMDHEFVNYWFDIDENENKLPYILLG